MLTESWDTLGEEPFLSKVTAVGAVTLEFFLIKYSYSSEVFKFKKNNNNYGAY